MDWNKVRNHVAKTTTEERMAVRQQVSEKDVEEYYENYSKAVPKIASDSSADKYVSSAEYKTNSAALDALERRRQRALEYLSSNKNAYKNQDSLIKDINDSESVIEDLQRYNSSAKDFMSNYKTSNEYEEYIQNIRDQERLKYLNIKEARDKKYALEQELANIGQDIRDDIGKKGTSAIVASSWGKNKDEKVYNNLASEEDNERRIELEREIQELTKDINLASRLQNADYQKKTALNASDLEQYSAEGKKIRDDLRAQSENVYGTHETFSKGYRNPNVIDQTIKYLNDEEEQIYDYYLGKYGEERADEFLYSIADEVNYRKAEAMYEGNEDNVLYQHLFGLTSGLEQFKEGTKGGLNMLLGNDEYVPTTANQYAASLAREDLVDVGKLPEWATNIIGDTSIGQMTFDLTQTTANMLPSIILGHLGGGIVGNAFLGFSASGNAYNEMISEGFDKEQATSYAALVGASESLLEHFLGGFTALGGKLGKVAVSKFLTKVDNALARVAINTAKSGISEFTEEYLQEILDPVFRNLALNEDNDFELITEEAIYSGILGALSAGVIEGPTIISNEINYQARDKALAEQYSELAGQAIESGLKRPEKTDIRKLAEAAQKKTEKGKTLSGRAMQELVQTEDKAKITEAVENRLKALGETEETALVAKAIAKKVAGEKLSANETYALNHSKYGERVTNELDPYNIVTKSTSSEWVKDIGTADINKGIYSKEVKAEGGKEAEKTESTKPVDVVKEAYSKAGIRIGSVGVSPKDTVKSVLSNVEDITPNAAEKIADIFSEEKNVQPETFIRNAVRAYRVGYLNTPLEYAKNVILDDSVSISASTRAYYAGVEAFKQKHKGEAIAQQETTIKGVKGKVVFESGVDRTKLKPQQRVAIEVMEKVLANATNIEFHVFESYVKNGKRYFKDQNGNEIEKAPNGQFVNGKHQIWVDINAGGRGEGTMLYTLFHELTHNIHVWSPEHFSTLAQITAEAFAKGGYSFEAAVNQKVAQYSKYENYTRDDCIEEVIAEAMSGIGYDGKVIEDIANRVKAEDKTLWQKIVDWLSSIVERIKKAYAKYPPSAPEAKILMEQKELFEKAQKVFAEAVVESGRAYEEFSGKIGEVNLNELTEAKDSDGKELLQIRAMETDEQEYRRMLEKWGQLSDQQITNLFDTIDKAMEVIKSNLEALDYAWDSDIDGRVMFPVKPNSDSLYQISIDFSTLCRKRLLQQMVQAQLQQALNRQLTRDETIEIRKALMKIRDEGKQIEVACALCYVESARMKSPKQITKFLNSRETVLRDFFAGKNVNATKQAMIDAEEEIRGKYNRNEKKGKKYKEGLKQLPKDIRLEIQNAKKAIKSDYVPTAEEQELIKVAKGLTVSDFTTPEGLENLARKYPRIFDGYTSFVRNATKSKGLEKDTWWRAHDADSISDTLIKNMNKENGLRSQSWSDFQVIHLMDYIAAVIELSTRNSKMQVYTKVPDFAELMGLTNAMINLSLIPKAVFKGKLEFDSIEGMDFNKSLELRDKYHNSVGNIVIGINDVQVKLAFDDVRIDYVIPYHESGMSKEVRTKMNIPTWKGYQAYQSEKKLKREDAVANAQKYGVALLEETNANYHKNPSFSEWFDYDEAKKIADKENAKPTDPTKYGKYGVMYGGYFAMQMAADKYIKLCAERGLAPAFSHPNANFVAEENYWKVLIDRKMIDNITGEIIEQKALLPIFNKNEVLRILNEELERYQSVKKDQDYAIRKVTQDFLAKDMPSSSKIATIMQKPVDNITQTNIVESGKIMAQERDANSGYDGYSMSRRAVEAYQNGEMPISKWNKTAILEAVEEIDPSKAKMLKNVPLAVLKDKVLVNTSWHHTSAKFNKTDFYSIDEDIIDELTEAEIEKWQTKTEAKKAEPVVRKGDFKYIEWAGTKNRPKPIEHSLEDVNIETRGSFYVVTDNAGNEIVRKKIGSSGTFVEYEEDKLKRKELAESLKKEAEERENNIRENSSAEAFALYTELSEKGYDSSYSGNMYHRGRKPTPYYHDNPQDFFKKGEQRLTPNSHSGYTLQTWDGAKWVNELGAKFQERDSDGRELSKEQVEYFKDSKVRDEQGNLLTMYHGTNNDFWTFDTNIAGGKNGIAEGYGIYLTDKKDVANSYGSRKIEAYVNIVKPATSFKKTITVSTLAKLIKDTCVREAQEFVDNGDYDNVKDALFDTWISNYVMTYDIGMERAYQEAARSILRFNNNDMDIIREVMSGMGIRSYADAMNFYHTSLTRITGFDGFATQWDSNGEKSRIYLAFDSNQVKSVSNTNPTADPDIRYSDRVTDKETLDFLENQEKIRVYRAMQVIDGKLYPPMAARVKSDDGKKQLVNSSEIGVWEQAVERPDLIRNGNKFELDKANGSSIQAAYNPYFHTSASPLNDQFSSAYKRDNLVIVEGEIPSSELTSGYKAEFAKDSVGETKWHAGPVASKLKGAKARRVFLSRWFKPLRIVPDAEVASIIAKVLEGENLDIPYNVVTPALRSELEKKGVSIKYSERDSEYMEAVNKGDMKTAQKLVDEAAREAGYTRTLYHGTASKFNVFGFGRAGIYTTDSLDVAKTYGENIISLYGKQGANVLTVDAKQSPHYAIRVSKDILDFSDYPLMRGKELYSTNDISRIAFREDYDVVVIKNVYDNFSFASDNKQNGLGTDVVYKDSNQVKSANPVTYDDNGNVIPLSERFNKANEDIRYSEREGNGATFNGKPFWSGSVSLLDGMIEEVHSYAEAENSDFHHSMYFSANQIEKMANGENAFFFVEDGKVYGDWRASVPKDIVNRIEEQITKYSEGQPLYQEREEDLSERGVLANALEGMAQNDAEKKKLKSYKRDLAEYDELGVQLHLMRAELEDAKKAKDSAKVRELKGKIVETENRLDIYDKKLLKLEATAPLKALYERERDILKAKADERVKKAVERQKARDDERLDTAIEKAKKQQREAVGRLKKKAKAKGDEMRRVLKESQSYARADGFLAGQMSQGRKDAAEISKLKDRLETQRTEADRKLLEQAERYRNSIKKATEGRHKTEIRNKIKHKIGELNTMLKGTKERHVPESMRAAVASALDIVNLDDERYYTSRLANLRDKLEKATSSAEKKSIAFEIQKIELQQTRFKDSIEKLRASYDEINRDDGNILHDALIAEKIDRVSLDIGETLLKDMSMEQLEEVYDLFKMVLQKVREANKLFDENQKARITELGDRGIQEFSNKKKRNSKPRSKKQIALEKFLWNLEKPIYAFEKIGSKVLTERFNAIRRGEDVWSRDISEAIAFFEKAKKDYNYKKWDKNKTFEFESSAGNKFKLTVEQMMSIYAYSKRKDADKHLTLGGFVFDPNTKVGDKKLNEKYLEDATAYNISVDTIQAIAGKLTAEQRGFADVMQTYLSDVMGAKGNEVSMKMYDVKLFREKNYFPLKSAKQYMFETNNPAGEIKLKNSGFSKDRIPGANNPIILSEFTDVWASHVNDMSMYHAFVLPIEDFTKIYNYKTSLFPNQKSVKGEIENVYGTAATEYIGQLLKDINGGARTDSTAGAMNQLVGRFKKASVMASLSVVIQQPSAIMRAFSEINTKWLFGLPMSVPIIQHKKVWEEIKKYAPVAFIKEMGYFDTHMGLSTVDYIKNDKNLMEKVDDVLGRLPGYADEMTWGAIWHMVKRETKSKHPTMKVNSEEFLNLCGERFTDIIVRTQVYDSVLSRPAVMRSADGLVKMAVAFMAEPLTSLNMLEHSAREGKAKNRRHSAALASSVVSSIVFNSALSSLVYAMRDDEEDETFWEKYLKNFSKEVLDGFNPLTYIPLVKDIWSIAQGWDVKRADMDLFDKLYTKCMTLSSILFTDTEGMTEEEKKKHYDELGWAIAETIGALGDLFGIPGKNIVREAKSYLNVFDMVKRQRNEETKLENTKLSLFHALESALVDIVPDILLDPLDKLGILENKNVQDKIYDAVIAGDDVYLDRLRKEFDTEAEFNTQVRWGLRNNDERLKEATIARHEGRFTEYEKLVNDMVKSGFDKQNVITAVEAQTYQMFPEDEETSTSTTIKSLYHADDFLVAYRKKNSTAMQNIKKDIIDTYVKNGKTEDEAESKFNSAIYSAVREEYENGELSANESKTILENHSGRNEQQATAAITLWDYQAKYPNDDVEIYWIYDYHDEIESSGLDLKTYVDYRNEAKLCKGVDSNGDGRTDSGSVKKEKLLVIDALPISNEQKDAIYFAEGWAKSTLWEAPWR